MGVPLGPAVPLQAVYNSLQLMVSSRLLAAMKLNSRLQAIVSVSSRVGKAVTMSRGLKVAL